MHDHDLAIITGPIIRELLTGKEEAVVRLTRDAYTAYAHPDRYSLPHSVFLRFPSKPRDRIIALPAYLGAPFDIAGIKWISSFPGNVDHGLERASGILVLNDMSTGLPSVLLEASLISAARTAASALLAATILTCNQNLHDLSVIGCGVINLEVCKFFYSAYPSLRTFHCYDTSSPRAEAFCTQLQLQCPHSAIRLSQTTNEALAAASVISLATNAAHPHIEDLAPCQADAVILHISLRDLAPEVILNHFNIVDDVDHCCRANTSIHLAEQAVGHRNFVTTTLPDLLTGAKVDEAYNGTVKIFSPFGLGILDIAVGGFVRDLALSQKKYISIPSFFPAVAQNVNAAATSER